MFPSDSPHTDRAPNVGRTLRTVALARAHRFLLERPIVRRNQHADEYAVVARHVDSLETWHREHTGWPIHYNERAGIIRLRRRPALVPSGIWEPWKSDVVFTSPRDYACLVYLLWYARSPMLLGRGGVRQVLLSDLSNNLAQRSALRDDPDDPDGGAGEPYDFAKRRSDYYSLRRALKALEDLGAVLILDEANPGPNADEPGEALIEFTEVVESLIVDLDLRLVEAANLSRPDPFSLDAPKLDEETISPWRRVWRALLLGPVLLRRDDPVAFHALHQQRHVVEAEVEQLFGYVVELTPRYARLIRPTGVSFDRVPPVLNFQQRGLVQAGLLLCSAIRDRVAAGELPSPDHDGCLIVDQSTLLELFRQVCLAHQRRWGSGLAELRPDTIFTRVCDVLRTAGLLRGPNLAGHVLVLPTAAIYRAGYAQTPQPNGTPRSAASSEDPVAEQLGFRLDGNDR
ncbi:MAG TPA: DUF2398 family protein [Chloroflexota bacterium]|nr:DUF2398 family protein [Chloroflexota bacterium]